MIAGHQVATRADSPDAAGELEYDAACDVHGLVGEPFVEPAE